MLYHGEHGQGTQDTHKYIGTLQVHGANILSHREHGHLQGTQGTHIY